MATNATRLLMLLLVLVGGVAVSCAQTEHANHPYQSIPAHPTFKNATKVQTPHYHRIIFKYKKGVCSSNNLPKGFHTVSAALGISRTDIVGHDAIESELNSLLLQDKTEYAVKDTILWATGVLENSVPPFITETSPVPNSGSRLVFQDPDYHLQWGLTSINGINAWNTVNSMSIDSSSKITVCVVDSGVDVTHPDLQGRLHPDIGYNAIDKNYNVTDSLNHGTHVTGIISAVQNNGVFVAGVATDHVQILTCKFINENGFGYASDAITCIDYCLRMNSSIITNSWSGDEDNAALRDAIKLAYENGVVFIAAAGNGATNLDEVPAYPASYASEFPNIISVASTNYQGLLSNFSNYGRTAVQVAAPGEWILSTVPNNDVKYYSGTSMAAPFVAGTAALVLTASKGTLTAPELCNIITNTTKPLPTLDGKVMSGGLVQADQAVATIISQAKFVNRQLNGRKQLRRLLKQLL